MKPGTHVNNRVPGYASSPVQMPRVPGHAVPTTRGVLSPTRTRTGNDRSGCYLSGTLVVTERDTTLPYSSAQAIRATSYGLTRKAPWLRADPLVGMRGRFVCFLLSNHVRCVFVWWWWCCWRCLVYQGGVWVHAGPFLVEMRHCSILVCLAKSCA